MRDQIWKSIEAERERQEAKFPWQQVPLSARDGATMAAIEDHVRAVVDLRTVEGALTADDILAEEVMEFRTALAMGDREAILKEGVQVMAVVLRIFESDAFKALEGKPCG